MEMWCLSTAIMWWKTRSASVLEMQPESSDDVWIPKTWNNKTLSKNTQSVLLLNGWAPQKTPISSQFEISVKLVFSKISQWLNFWPSAFCLSQTFGCLYHSGSHRAASCQCCQGHPIHFRIFLEAPVLHRTTARLACFVLKKTMNYSYPRKVSPLFFFSFPSEFIVARK